MEPIDIFILGPLQTPLYDKNIPDEIWYLVYTEHRQRNTSLV